MPTFTYEPVTGTAYRVLDAHTREVYGTIQQDADGYWHRAQGATFFTGVHPTRDDATRALYHARHALGFEAGAL